MINYPDFFISIAIGSLFVLLVFGLPAFLFWKFATMPSHVFFTPRADDSIGPIDKMITGIFGIFGGLLKWLAYSLFGGFCLWLIFTMPPIGITNILLIMILFTLYEKQ